MPDPSTGEETSSLLTGLSAKDLMAEIMKPTQADDSGLAAAPPLSAEALAPHFPHLEILECLGRGGMGVVYKARQKSLNRLVALKLLAPERAGDPLFAQRFQKEAQALATLSHPHIVAVHDFGQAGGFYYLLMEFVDGMNLRQLLQSKRLTPKEALTIVPPICEALQCAHDHGIVHCDIKPENLLIASNGVVKIADFGIAKIIQPSTDPEAPGAGPSGAVGTPDYAAPEQSGGSADHRADIYSLGVVLYEMLTGERPQRDIEAPSKRAEVDTRIDEIVLRALEKQPELRFLTVTDLRTSVESLMSRKAEVTSGKKRSWITMAVWAAACSALLAAGLVFWGDPDPRGPKLSPPEIVDFNAGTLTDAFAHNVVIGRSGYALTPLGLAGSQGVTLAQTLGSEGTLVYHKQSFDLSKLLSLEVSCCFKRQPIGAGTHALALGLTGSKDGNLSGVPGIPFLALRLKPENESLGFQFQAKETDLGPPRSWIPPKDFITNEGEWYRLRVIFSRVNTRVIRVMGDVSEVDKDGVAGKKVGYFLPRDFEEPTFPVSEILKAPEVWVALRANGPGGVALVDDFRIIARPLPTKLK